MGEGFVWMVCLIEQKEERIVERVWRGFEFIDIAFLWIKKVENGSWW